MSLIKCIELLKKDFNDYHFEEQKIFEVCEKLRFFWKPKKVKLLLLAESHVYTSEEKIEIKHNFSKFNGLEFDIDDYPEEYVGLIYSLGYGENEILERNITNNFGTPQFWKLFYSSVNQVSSKDDFKPILKTKTKNHEERIKNKIKTLLKMKEKGIWLLDASLIAFYPDKSNKIIYEKSLNICWNNYIKEIIKKEKPKSILIIGKGVEKILENKVRDLGINFSSIEQPNARISTEKKFANYKILYDLANPNS